MAEWEACALDTEQITAEQGFQYDLHDRIDFLVDQLLRAARLPYGSMRGVVAIGLTETPRRFGLEHHPF